ncbi:hypothetical protein H2201_009048 [Coniosporium apollinis]|uniref:Uncharacterized protein n=1 Tax=Coniosporium apollinis TaxID=61459 RepID=A0ABQ9NFH3_9PEZI|nr:hypothetical protein H2201_009048 [Coniosporium apollinis]
MDSSSLFSEIQANSTRYERLDQRECIELYRKKAILDRKTVLVVTSDEEWQPGNSVLAYEEYVGNAVEIGTWFCPDDNIDDWGFISGSDCDIDAVLSGSEKWTPFASNVTVDYCLSEYLGEQCTLDFSLGLMIVTRPEIILTIGDAIASYNSALTSIVTAKEWDSYSKIRKSLRVTAPVGQQRSTYYLQLPFRYSIPLIITSILLHWLTSQAIFLDRRIVRQVWWGEPYTDNQVGSVNIVGYSPIAVIFCLLVGLILILALLWIGYRKFTPGMPIAGNNSAAISAACHPPADDVDASIVPVMWGAIPTPSAYWKDGSGHCSFTSFWVESPVQGCQYL